MALIKSMLEKLIAELKKAPPEVKSELKSALGEETVTAPEVKEEPENKVADPVQETEVKDEVKEETETDGNGEKDHHKSQAAKSEPSTDKQVGPPVSHLSGHVAHLDRNVTDCGRQ